MLSRKCNIDERGSQPSGMRVSLYIFENSRRRDARLRCCSIFHGPRYHVPKRSSPSKYQYEVGVMLEFLASRREMFREREVHGEGREPLLTISRLTCIHFITFRIPENIHVSDLYG